MNYYISYYPKESLIKQIVCLNCIDLKTLKRKQKQAIQLFAIVTLKVDILYCLKFIIVVHMGSAYFFILTSSLPKHHISFSSIVFCSRLFNCSEIDLFLLLRSLIVLGRFLYLAFIISIEVLYSSIKSQFGFSLRHTNSLHIACFGCPQSLAKIVFLQSIVL